MEYFYSVVDRLGFTHSIDNCIIEYVTAGGDKALSKILSGVQELGEKFKDSVSYYERLNLKPCTKYSFAQHVIHLDDGIFLSIGVYVNYEKKTVDKIWNVYPVVKLEVNPNKHFGKQILDELIHLLLEWSHDVNLVRYDYAIDVPLSPQDVNVFGSRKEKGLYKGTRYYGQRNKNGYCKIYDKMKESGLDSPMTRIEHTIGCGKGSTKNISFEPVYIKQSGEAKETQEKLTPSDVVILDLARACMNNGIDIDDIIDKLDKRKKRSIVEQLRHGGFERLEFDQQILDDLLRHVFMAFSIKRLKCDTSDFENVVPEELPFY